MKNEIKNEPRIRFKGYIDEWEDRRLGDYLSIPEKEKVKITDMSDLMTLRLNLRGISAGTNRETLELGSTIYYKRKAGQFLYGKQNFFNGSMAIIPNELDGKATSGDVPALDISNINSEFLYTYVSRHDYWKRKEATASGTGSKRIHESTLMGFGIEVPRIDEQREISMFFKQLDNTTTLHQRELDLLKQAKQGYLQKMFPKDGEDQPEIRFTGFTDAWEERKLSDVKDVRDGTHDSPKYYQQGYPLVTSKNLSSSGLDMSVVSLISYEDFESINKRSKVDVGDIIFGMIGTIGNPVIIDRSDFAIKNVALIKGKGEVPNTFLIQLLKSPIFERYIRNENAGNTQKFLGLSKIRDYVFFAPSTEEMFKIGSFFKQLDDTIALHQRELDSLKTMKKSLLQQMFI